MKSAMGQRNSSTGRNGGGSAVNEQFSRRSVVTAIAGTGFVLGAVAILFGLGLILQKNLSSLIASQPNRQEIQKRAEARIDEAIKAGHLAAARTELEKMEDEYGLEPGYSEKLDKVYVALSKQSRERGDNAEAIKLLRLIPSESSIYKTAQHELTLIATAGKHHKKTHVKSHGKARAASRRHHS